MAENEKNELNEKSDYSSVFEFNDSEADASYVENMNRDYLYAIYGSEMNSLTKQVRYTRTKYLRDLMTANSRQEAEHKANLKNFLKVLPAIVIALVLSLFSLCGILFLYNLAKRISYLAMFTTHYFEYFSASPNEAYKACYLMCGVFGFFTALFFVIFVILLLTFGLSAYNKKKAIDKTHSRTVEAIETKKKENMLNGTYDPLK